jgi:hypothetical protein
MSSALADGHRLDLTLVSRNDEFVYWPLSAEEPFAVCRTPARRAEQRGRSCGSGPLADTISAVDPQRKLVTTAGGDQLAYDALMPVVGAEPGAGGRAGPTWDDRAEAEIIGGLLRTFRELDPALTVRTLSMRSSRRIASGRLGAAARAALVLATAQTRARTPGRR